MKPPRKLIARVPLGLTGTVRSPPAPPTSAEVVDHAAGAERDLELGAEADRGHLQRHRRLRPAVEEHHDLGAAHDVVGILGGVDQEAGVEGRGGVPGQVAEQVVGHRDQAGVRRVERAAGGEPRERELLVRGRQRPGHVHHAVVAAGVGRPARRVGHPAEHQALLVEGDDPLEQEVGLEGRDLVAEALGLEDLGDVVGHPLVGLGEHDVEAHHLGAGVLGLEHDPGDGVAVPRPAAQHLHRRVVDPDDDDLVPDRARAAQVELEIGVGALEPAQGRVDVAPEHALAEPALVAAARDQQRAGPQHDQRDLDQQEEAPAFHAVSAPRSRRGGCAARRCGGSGAGPPGRASPSS